MKANPWLFRRMVALGIAAETMPVYVFSDAAADEVAQLNGSVTQERMAEVAVLPHKNFCIEMSVGDATGVLSDKFRTLTMVLDNGDMENAWLQLKARVEREAEPVRQAWEQTLDNLRYTNNFARWTVTEVQHVAGKMIILPPIYMAEVGKYAAMEDNEVGREVLREIIETYARRMTLVLDPKRFVKFAHEVCLVKDASLMPPKEYNIRAGEAVSFLTTACAVMASPAATKESGTSPMRIKATAKGRERKVETRWTHVDVDLDRAASVHDDGDEAEARGGVALHPVRAHLRVTQYGVSAVRAHMRGDARFGVRHRVGHVNKAGE